MTDTLINKTGKVKGPATLFFSDEMAKIYLTKIRPRFVQKEKHAQLPVESGMASSRIAFFANKEGGPMLGNRVSERVRALCCKVVSLAWDVFEWCTAVVSIHLTCKAATITDS